MKTGNFAIGEAWCDVKCKYGHEIRMLNIGRGHWAVCDICKSAIFLGSNLASSWRDESEDDWVRNSDSINGYKIIL
jgi:hypothetical protein